MILLDTDHLTLLTPNRWSLIDQYEPVRSAEDIKPIVIESAENLVKLLDERSKGLPRLVILKALQGQAVFIGIGGELAGVLYFDGSAIDAGLYAKPLTSYSHTARGFISEGIETVFPPPFLMPPNEVFAIASWIYSNNQLPDWVEWTSNPGAAGPNSTTFDRPAIDGLQELRDIPF